MAVRSVLQIILRRVNGKLSAFKFPQEPPVLLVRIADELHGPAVYGHPQGAGAVYLVGKRYAEMSKQRASDVLQRCIRRQVCPFGYIRKRNLTSDALVIGGCVRPVFNFVTAWPQLVALKTRVYVFSAMDLVQKHGVGHPSGAVKAQRDKAVPMDHIEYNAVAAVVGFDNEPAQRTAVFDLGAQS